MVTRASFWLSKTCVDRSETAGLIESADHLNFYVYEHSSTNIILKL